MEHVSSTIERRPEIAGTETVSAKVSRLRAQEQPWLAVLETLQYRSASTMLYIAVFKPAFDFVMAAVLVVLLSPLLLLVALAIRLENRGPVFFRQTRIGRHGQPFVVWKFRTMIADRRSGSTPYDGPERRLRHKTRNDPRLTRLGTLLRRTSIDELPQLFNVLRGEMSLIGPRPELPGIVSRYASWQHQRHLVRPGLTGWWQVRGRSELPMHENTELDLYYVMHQSLGLDLRILAETVRAVAGRSGAF